MSELNIRIESINEIKNVDAAIDFLDRDFDDEECEYKNE
jgi:hypothetical protein